VIAQLLGTSLWFSINGVWLSYAHTFDLADSHLGYLTLAVQIGFISGTLLMALSGLADRYKASQIFALACFVGAAINVLMVNSSGVLLHDVLLRFLTGLCLAGIYPLGMKLVISWVPTYAGAALSWLVGMLTIGTSLPHLLRGVTLGLSWQWPIVVISVLSVIGGLLVLFLGTGTHLPAQSGRLHLGKGFLALKQPNFRAVAGGYFGHCWELYAFWMLVPLLVTREIYRFDLSTHWIPILSFLVIGLGAFGCVFGGVLSKTIGSFNVARVSLFMSGTLCLIYPLLSETHALFLLLLLMLWGITVVADSPQFSALAAVNAPVTSVGSSLAMMNAIGFALTLPSIWITSLLWNENSVWVVLWLLPGPVIGFWALQGLRNTEYAQ
jgi:DHA1 family inner membrane transport protein